MLNNVFKIPTFLKSRSSTVSKHDVIAALSIADSSAACVESLFLRVWFGANKTHWE